MALHSQPILEQLAQSFVDKFGFNEESLSAERNEDKLYAKHFVNTVLRKVPSRGTILICSHNA